MKITVPSYVLAQSMGDEMVVLNMENDFTYGLERVAGAFWNCIQDHQGDVESITTAMLERFEVGEAELRSDLTELIEFLSTEGLVEISS